MHGTHDVSFGPDEDWDEDWTETALHTGRVRLHGDPGRAAYRHALSAARDEGVVPGRTSGIVEALNQGWIPE